MPIAWSFDPTDAPPIEDPEGAIAAAFDAWSLVDGTGVSFFADNAGIGSGESGHDLVNFVYFDPAWPEDEEAIALASTWSSPDGVLLGFDIRLDATTEWSTAGDADAYDLQAALTHEIGHTLGLEHSDVGGAVDRHPRTAPRGNAVSRPRDGRVTTHVADPAFRVLGKAPWKGPT
jgi:hypothetical protein